MIPEGRQIIQGRSWPQAWEPRAVEHYRVHRWRRLSGPLLAVCIGLALAAVLVHGLAG